MPGSSGVVVPALDCSPPTGTVPPLGLEVVATGMVAPLLVKAAPGDDTGLYIVQQNGVVALVRNGVLLPTPFLNVSGRVIFASEMGLLGLAFHPGYASNGRFFVYYMFTNGHERLVEHRRDANDPDRADPAQSIIVMDFYDPEANHNGGSIEFGPDGFLYIATGDGGGAGDLHGTFGNAQDLGSPLGKILRIDVDNPPATPPLYNIPPGNMTAIPPGNPSSMVLPEVWDFGLRNPWRTGFDPCNGDFYIADVGQGNYEEVNHEPPGQGNRNYGWRLREGAHNFNPETYPTNLCVDPVVEYLHQSGRCSISGGFVYRGNTIPALRGAYFYGDYCTGEVWYTFQNGLGDPTPVMVDFGMSAGFVSGFGQDNVGNVYVCDHDQGGSNGVVYRIIPR